MLTEKGNPVDRGEAIAFLKDISANRTLIPKWVSLVNTTSGYEVHIKTESVSMAPLKLIAEKHNLAIKEVKGLLIVYREHNVFHAP